MENNRLFLDKRVPSPLIPLINIENSAGVIQKILKIV